VTRAIDRLLTLLPVRVVDTPVRVPDTPEYASARDEAATMARNLGLDISNEHWEHSSIADFLRLCYAQGWKACERRLMSPDTADAIAVAIQDPKAIIAPTGTASTNDHRVRAVQQAAVFGVPK
jgi:hypothetical protein